MPKVKLLNLRMIFTAMLAVIAISIMAAGCGDNADDDDDIINDGNLNSGSEPERISVAELKNLQDSKADIVLVDVRSRESYDAGHIPGAISMEYSAEIRARYSELPQDKTIILYCS